MLPFLLAMMTMLTASAVMKDAARAGTVFILLVNWAICTFAWHLSRDGYPWEAYIAADYVAALAIQVIRSRSWQTAVMVIFAVQIVNHGAYALFSDRSYDARSFYLGNLGYLAWAQLVVCGGSIAVDVVRRLDWFKSRPSYRHVGIETVETAEAER